MPEGMQGREERYLVVIDPAASMDAVSADLQARGLRIDSRLDVIRTLVVAGDPAAASAAANMRGVESIEREGSVHSLRAGPQ